MGVTNFPNGISTEGVEITPSVAVGGTVIAGAGTVASGLTTVSQVVASLTSVQGTAAGRPVACSAVPSSGNVILRVEDATGATVSGTVHFVAYGS